jgi:serine/threonine protein kinase/WD40 repeat protein/tetratricopeptide (TPR) repeat protein
MSEPSSGLKRDPVEELLESFLARWRQGERPGLEEYVARCPDRADEIRELFPAMIEMEQLKPAVDLATGSLVRPATRPDPAPLSAAPHPERLGDFKILRVIGEGGMGVVYEAEHESLKSRVALKVMHRRFRADRSYLRRFHTEARSAARLHHTNIVPVFDFGEQDGICYYAMQFIPGFGLDRVLDDVRRLRTEGDEESSADGPASPSATETAVSAVTRGLMTGRFATAPGTSAGSEPPRTQAEGDGPTQSLGFEIPDDRPNEPPVEGETGSSTKLRSGRSELAYFREVARLGAQVADALDYAHRQKVVHRDIKPSNLLLDAQGNVWVTDFGLAKLIEGEDLSQSHDLAGTLRFMAPERLRGVTDRRSDIYALGATLYEMLALRPAFPERDQVKLIEQIAHDSPPQLRQHDPRIPRDLETIVHKALAKAPADRCEKASELRDELRRFLDGRPTRWRRVGPVEQFRRWCKRNPWLAAANITAAVMTTVLAIGSTIAAWIYRDQVSALQLEERRTSQARRGLVAQLDLTKKAEAKAQLALGISLVSEGAALQRTGLIGQRFESLERLGRAAKILGADTEGRKQLPAIRNHAIAALGLTDLRVRWEHDCGPSIFDTVRFDAAMERYAVVERSGAVVVRRVDDNRELVRFAGPDPREFSYAGGTFSPDGELLVADYHRAGGEGYLLRVYHLGRRELLSSVLSRGGAAFHPDGRRVLYYAPEGGIAIWDRDKRRMVRRLPLDFAPGWYALDPEGRRLAVSNADRAAPRVAILEFETGRVLADWRSQVGTEHLAWSADGQLLAIGGVSGDPRVYVWNVRRGELASVLQGHTNDIIGAQFAYSGFLLATTSWHGMTRLWNAAAGESLLTAAGYHRGFSPDDRRLAIQNGLKIEVWEVAAALECQTLHPRMFGNRTEERGTTSVYTADVSPDGRLVATSDGDGVCLWEAETGREVGSLKAGHCDTVLFHPDGRSLISSGSWGLYRWPIRPDPERGADAIRIGPPELLRETSAREGSNRAAWLPGHKTLAQIDNNSARVLLVDSSHPHPAWTRAPVLESGGNRRMATVSVSPDGRWLATGGWNTSGIQVWDLRDRRLKRILRPKEAVGNINLVVGFSPDGQWLVSDSTSGRGPWWYHFWRVGTWEPSHRIDQERDGNTLQQPAFTRDGRLMAVGIAPDQVLLAEVATGRELARLTTQQPVTPAPLVFSPDGTKLVASTRRKTVLVWDLRRIRDQLIPMGLDWDAPPYPSGAAASEASGPLPPPRPVRVVGEVIEPRARRAAELAEMNRRLATNPDDAEALIHRGWLFTRQMKWPAAIADLERRLRLRPDDPDACWLLAEAYQEVGNLAGALAALSRRLELAPVDRDARNQRGLLALALARPDLAADDFTRILAAEPNLEPARYRRAQALIRLGRHHEALADLDVLIVKDPNNDALYQLRCIAHEALGEPDQARADREKLIALLPKDPMALNNRAWTLATGPVTDRDPERAVTLARRSVELAPAQQLSLNTLGVALYRAGQHAEAVSVLEQSLAAGKGEFDAFDLFFLAMAHHRLGHATLARACFDRAVRWLSERKNLPAQHVTELTSFRTEAEVVLALNGPPPELPAGVFAPEPPDHP